MHLVIALLAAAVALGGGLTRPRDGERPRRDASVLLLTGLALWAVADYRFLEVISDTGDVFEGRRALTAFFALIALAALACWVRAGSAACLLVGALATGGTAIAAVQWIFDTENIASFRPVLLVLGVVFASAAWLVRGRDREVLVDAAGLAILSIGLLGGSIFFLLGGGLPDAWEAVVLAGGLATIAYSAATRAPGPGVIGLLTLVTFATSAITVSGAEFESEDGSAVETPDLDLVGWPLVLLGMSLVAFVFGILRSRRDHQT